MYNLKKAIDNFDSVSYNHNEKFINIINNKLCIVYPLADMYSFKFINIGTIVK